MMSLRISIAALTICAGLLTAQTHEVTQVKASVVERTSRLPGEFLPYLSVDIYARVTGFVEKITVDRGSVVKKGEPLVTLVAPEMAAQLAEAEAHVQAVESQRAEAEAKHVAAQSTYEHLKEASKTPGVVAGNDLMLAEKAVESARALTKALESSAMAARASVDALRELQDYLNVAAPFDGIITKRFVHPGALVGPGAGAANGPLVTLEQNSRLRLVVAVPEAGVPGIIKGARVPFAVPAYPGRTFHGTVARIAHSMDPKTRTMAVEMDVNNSGGALAPGMYPDVQWTVRNPKPALLVPQSSIVTTTERNFVIRVNNGQAEWVDVSRGLPAGDLVQVTGALKAGDTILKSATDEIRPGSKL